MVHRFLVLAAFVFSPVTFAGIGKSYKLNFEVGIDGRKISAREMIVREGRAARITDVTNGRQTTVEVVAENQKDGDADALMMKFDVRFEEGNRVLHSRPQILALLNEPAMLIVGKKGENEEPEVSLRVTAKPN